MDARLPWKPKEAADSREVESRAGGVLDAVGCDEEIANEGASLVADGAALEVQPLGRLVACQCLSQPRELVKSAQAHKRQSAKGAALQRCILWAIGGC